MTTEDTLKELGRRIRSLREQQPLTQEQLAGKASISRSYLAQIETGRKAASFPVLLRIAEALGVSVEVLLGSEPESTYLRALREERERYRHATETISSINIRELLGTRRGILLETIEGMTDEEVERLTEIAELIRKQHKEPDS